MPYSFFAFVCAMLALMLIGVAITMLSFGLTRSAHALFAVALLCAVGYCAALVMAAFAHL